MGITEWWFDSESRGHIKFIRISSLEPKSLVSGGKRMHRVTLYQQTGFPFLGPGWLAADPELSFGEPQDRVKSLRHSTRSPPESHQPVLPQLPTTLTLPGTLPPSFLASLASLGYRKLMIPEENDHQKDTHIHSTSLCAKQCCEYSPPSVTSSPWCPPCCVVRKVYNTWPKRQSLVPSTPENERKGSRTWERMVEEKEAADSGPQNEGGEKTRGFLPPTPPHPTATVAGKTMAFLRHCADKAALKKTNGRD